MTVRTEWRRLREDLGELIARHETARDVTEFERYADDPVGFFRDVLGGDPWSRQEEVAEAVRDRPLVVVRSANAVGKDWTAARLALWWVYCRRGLALITGPTERQVREVVMGEVAKAFRRAEDLPGELYAMSLRLHDAEDAGILAFTSTEASKLTGFHAPRVLAIITEAQGVEDFAWEGVLACAVGDEDRILAVGNPIKPSGRFYDASRSKVWHAIRISVHDHPNLVNERTVIPGGPSRAFVDRIASEFGRDSGVFVARVEGEFPEESTEALIRRRWIDEAVELWRAQFARGWGGPCTFGLDVARHGPDATCLAVWQQQAVRKLVTWRGTDSTESADRIEREAAEVGVRPETVVVDATGLGWGVHDELNRRGWPVVAFVAAKSAKDSDRFANARAEAAWRCREALEARTLPLPPDEDLHEELLAVEWGVNTHGRIAIESKDDLRARLRRSPDRADAVILLAWELKRPSVSFLWGSRHRRRVG